MPFSELDTAAIARPLSQIAENPDDVVDAFLRAGALGLAASLCRLSAAAGGQNVARRPNVLFVFSDMQPSCLVFCFFFFPAPPPP